MEPSKRGNSQRSGAFSVLVSHCVVVVAVVLPSGPTPLLMNINKTTLYSTGRPTD